MRVAIYQNHRDNVPDSLELEWPELCELLSTSEETECLPCAGKLCLAKFGQAWSPVNITGARANDNVTAITVAVFDLDHLTNDALAELATNIDGLTFILHSTHTHAPPDDMALRLVVPLSRPVLATEWRRVLKAAIATYNIPADASCKDLSRLYFLPTRPKGAPFLCESGEGTPLDVDELLALANHPDFAAIDPAVEPVMADALDAAPVEMSDLRKCLADSRRRKAGSTKEGDGERYQRMGAVLQGTPLCEPDGQWNVSVNQTASLLAFTLPAGTPTEAAIEMMRPSLAAMDRIDTTPKGVDYWIGVAESSYTRATVRRAERDAEQDERNERLAKGMSALIKVRPKASPTAPEASAEPSVSATAEEDDGLWMADLLLRADKTFKACGENVVLILSRNPLTKGTIRWNEVEKTIVLVGGPFAGVALDDLDVTVTDWLQREFGMTVSEQVVGSRLLKVARMNSFDPLKDYLNGLVWDGNERASEWLMDYCHARTVDLVGLDITEHIKAVGLKWLISAVARALEPGCQADTVLVLEGEQGLGKTTAFRVLGGEWFCDTQLVLGDKDAKMLAAQSWIIELAELASVKRSDNDVQKAFLTAKVDKYRPPYGRVLCTSPRRCVFVGTINPDEAGYLKDRTGNRRYLPIHCDGKVDRARLEADRDQLWAEAVHMYKAGNQWWLDDEEQRGADVAAEERLADSPIEARVAAWWFGMQPSRRPAEVGTVDVAELALKYTLDKITHGVQTEIGLAFKRMGFRKTRKNKDGRLAYLYVPTNELRSAQASGARGALRAIATATATVAPDAEETA